MKQYSNSELVTLVRQIVAGKLAATIIHKAKNILMPITGYVELIEGGSSSEKAEGYFRKIESSGMALQLLLKNFLRFSRPLQEKVTEEVDLPVLIDDITSLFEHRMTIAKVTLKKDVNPGTGKVPGVYDDISLIIASVLLNAIESSPQGGIIRLGTEVLDNAVNISIDDDGEGVSEEIKEKIFEPFFTTKNGSLGLGLSISHFLAKDMSGDLVLKNKNRFIFSLCQKKF